MEGELERRWADEPVVLRIGVEVESEVACLVIKRRSAAMASLAERRFDIW